MASNSLTQDLYVILFDSAVWPKFRSSLLRHSMFTFVVFSLWALAFQAPLDSGLLIRGLVLSFLQPLCLVFVLFRAATGSGNKHPMKWPAEVALFVGFSVLGALCTSIISCVVSWVVWLPGPIYGLSILLKPAKSLVFPNVLKPRISELKDCIKSNVAPSFATATTLWGLHIAGSLGKSPVTWDGIESASALCVYLWLVGADLFEVSIKEGHKFRLETTGEESLPKALVASNAVKQALAFSDLCRVSEERGIRTCRRCDLFRSEGTEAQVVWNKVANECLAEVQGLIVNLGTCVAKEHNEVFRGLSPARLSAHKKNIAKSLEFIQLNFAKVSVSARSLAGLACASRDEDQTGIVRTGDPGLERLVGSLVEALVVLDNLIREKETWESCIRNRQSSIPILPNAPWGHHRAAIDDAAAMFFIFRGCVASLCGTFGATYLHQVLQSSNARPQHVTAAALQEVLNDVTEIEN